MEINEWLHSVYLSDLLDINHSSIYNCCSFGLLKNSHISYMSSNYNSRQIWYLYECLRISCCLFQTLGYLKPVVFNFFSLTFCLFSCNKLSWFVLCHTVHFFCHFQAFFACRLFCCVRGVDRSSSGSPVDDPLRPAQRLSGRWSGRSHDAETLSLWWHRQRRQPHGVHRKT